MAYAQPHGYGQQPPGSSNPMQNYQYDNYENNSYGYDGGAGYDAGGHDQAQNGPHHGRARYVDPGYEAQQAHKGVIVPQTSYTKDHYGGGYSQQEQGYGDQGAYSGSNASSGFQPQSRPPPQRPGHDAQQGLQQLPARQSNDRPPPTRNHEAPRPSTGGSNATRQAPRPHDHYSSGQQAGPHPVQRDRILPNSPHSPQTMAWDNPFGSFGQVAADDKPRPRDPSRPMTADGNRHGQTRKQSSESSRSHNQIPRQQPQGDYHQAPNNPDQRAQHPTIYEHGERTAKEGYSNSASYQQDNNHTPAAGLNRGPAPNFSRVQSPPIRNQYTPPQVSERSNTMPTEVMNNGFTGQARIGTPPTFQTDLPFREGRAQTPVYAQPQYAEAQSAVIESASDPPTAASDWTEAAGPRAYQPTQAGMLAPDSRRSHDQQPSAHSSYGDFFDEYYDSRKSQHGHADEMDMPNFGNDRGNDELHLTSGTPPVRGQPTPQRNAYSDHGSRGGPQPPPQNDYQQDHGFNFGTSDQYDRPATEPPYNGYQQYDQGQSPPNMRPPPQQYMRGGGPGRGMPPRGRGMPPRGRGYPNPQDRSVSAGPGPIPSGAPYGAPPNGRGMPPPRGRGGPPPQGYGADTRGPMSPGPGGLPSRGRGGPMRGGPPPGRGRGGDMSGPPAPMRPGLMQQNPTPSHPAPVRQYNNLTGQNQPPNQYRPPSTSEATPVTHGELQRLRMAITDNPGDQVTTLVFVKKLVEATSTLANEGNDPKAKARSRERYVDEAYKLLKKLVNYNNPEAMFYMAECHGQGTLGLAKDPKEAFLLYQSAAKLGHAPSAYRVAVCCELGENEGGGTKRDPMKAMQWYRRAATLGDLPAMYKLGVILLKGLLGQNPQIGEAVNWLQRAADRADAENPHALHELGLLYENPPQQAQNNVIPDANYSFELFTQAAGLGYKFSQFKLGQVYEFAQLGCPIDARQSIAWYSKAAVQEEHQSELALSGWYLTGSEGVIQQSDTEAYLWARKAAQAGLAKAEYAMGYYTETGIGCSANLEDAKRWYWRAASQNFPKARERLEDLRKGGAKAQTRVSRGQMQKTQGDCKVM